MEWLQTTDPTSGCPAEYNFTCRCKLETDVWEDPVLCVIVYPRAGLVVIRGMLVRCERPVHFTFGRHKIDWFMRIQMKVARVDDRMRMFMHVTSVYGQGKVTSMDPVAGVGLQRIRMLQRRVRLWLWKRQASLAFMMASHPRLGGLSSLRALDEDVLRLCLQHL